VIVAAVALIGAILIVWARSVGVFGRDGIQPRLIAACLLWTIAIAGFWLALHQQNFDPAKTGLWTFGWRQLITGLLFGALGLLAFPAYILLAKKFGGKPQNSETLKIFASASIIQRSFLLVTAAGAEEVIFRAVAIGSLMAAGVTHIVAMAIPLLIFVLLHRSSWGVLHLLFVTVAGILMTGAFIMGGLWAAILAHLIVDAPLMFAGKAMAERANSINAEKIERN
jgi:membrane protease YdiL (CAAX protease family)